MKKLRSIVGNYILFAMQNCKNDVLKLFLQLAYSKNKKKDIDNNFITFEEVAKINGVIYKCDFSFTAIPTTYSSCLPAGDSVEIYRPTLNVSLFSKNTRGRFVETKHIDSISIKPKDYGELIGCYRKEHINIDPNIGEAIRKTDVLDKVKDCVDVTDDEKFVASIAKDVIIHESGNSYVYTSRDNIATQAIEKTKDIISLLIYKVIEDKKVNGCNISKIKKQHFFIEFLHRQFCTADFRKHSVEITMDEVKDVCCYVKGGHSDKSYARKLIFTDANLK